MFSHLPERNASAIEEALRVCIEGRRPDDVLIKKIDSVLSVCIENFAAFNDEQDYGEKWNWNDLCFLTSVLMRPAPRRTPKRDWAQSLVDSRLRVAVAACRHRKVVSGEVYISLEERQELARIEAAKPVYWKKSLEDEQKKAMMEIDEPYFEEVKDDWFDARQKRNERVYQEFTASEELRQKKLHQQKISRSADIDSLLDEVRVMIVGAFNDEGGVSTWLAKLTEDAPTPSDTELVKERVYLTNNCEGVQNGYLFDDRPESVINDWLPICTHALLHMQIERKYIDKFPSTNVVVSDGVWRCGPDDLLQSDVDAFDAWIDNQVQCEIPNQIAIEVRLAVCDFFLPAGARTFVRRKLQRLDALDADVVMQWMVGTNPTAEIVSTVDDERKIRGVVKDRSHAMHDVVAMCAVYWGCSEDQADLAFYSNIVMPNSDLLQCGSNLDDRPLELQPRGPLICHMGGSWRVHFRKRWFVASRFAVAWLWWLKLLTEHHGCTVACDQYDVSKWLKRLNIARWKTSTDDP